MFKIAIAAGALAAALGATPAAAQYYYPYDTGCYDDWGNPVECYNYSYPFYGGPFFGFGGPFFFNGHRHFHHGFFVHHGFVNHGFVNRGFVGRPFMGHGFVGQSGFVGHPGFVGQPFMGHGFAGGFHGMNGFHGGMGGFHGGMGGAGMSGSMAAWAAAATFIADL
jgi:hypothetical protein